MKKQNRAIALLLCLCLLFGLIPTSAFAIDWMTYDVVIMLDNFKVATGWSSIKEQFENATNGQTVLVKVDGKVKLPEPLRNTKGASFHIVGERDEHTIIPDDTGEGDSGKFQDAHLLTFENGTGNSKLYIQNLTLDGDEKTGLVSVSGYGEVWFGSEDKVPNHTANVTFKKGYTGMEKAGSVRLEEVPHAVMRNCWFDKNNGNLNSANTGCLYYSMKGELADPSGYSTGLYIDACKFTGNKAHSGGAMYVYGNSAYAYVGPDCVFTGNHATQRGGAIQCHGTMTVDDSTFDGNSSDGLGGAFYVSASRVGSAGKQENYFGVLTLSGRPCIDGGKGLTISGSKAGTAGGAFVILVQFWYGQSRKW